MQNKHKNYFAPLKKYKLIQENKKGNEFKAKQKMNEIYNKLKEGWIIYVNDFNINEERSQPVFSNLQEALLVAIEEIRYNFLCYHFTRDIIYKALAKFFITKLIENCEPIREEDDQLELKLNFIYESFEKIENKIK